ncbi:hypothetical protein PoB_006027900 [Plakobranchus ocellatus]|uniref:Uncharacterized protein n=1 Tax=Plakobranchus ocellatus TaxID=259542 RepID=A0AAV4CPJ4_9GAST|nr:hypothetical protein PoB_006027900 [Plakobranchus ocellatus]
MSLSFCLHEFKHFSRRSENAQIQPGFHQLEKAHRLLNASCPGLAYTIPSLDYGQGPALIVVSSKGNSSTVTVNLTGKTSQVTFGNLKFGHQEQFEIKVNI